MQGWIKLHRQLSSSDLWKSEPFTRGQAWVDLILLANHKEGFIRARGIKLRVERGQVGVSQDTLSKRWQWSRGKVVRFLNELEMEQQIVQQKNNVTSLLSITNYNQYQSNDTTNDTTNGQQTVQQTDTNKNVKNKKNEKEDTKSDQVLEVIQYLNLKSGKNFKVAKGLLERFREGYSVDDAKRVIDVKVAEWGNDNKMKQFIRPATLFSGKFDQYLNQDEVKQSFNFDTAPVKELNDGTKVKVDYDKLIVYGMNGQKHPFLEVDANGAITA